MLILGCLTSAIYWFLSTFNTLLWLCCVFFSLQDHDYLTGRRRGMSKRLTRDLPLVKLLNISITMSPFLSVDTTQFHTSLTDGTEAYWLSLPSAPQGQLVRPEWSSQSSAMITFKRDCFDFILVAVVVKRCLPSKQVTPLSLRCDGSIHQKTYSIAEALNLREHSTLYENKPDTWLFPKWKLSICLAARLHSLVAVL